MDFRKIIDTLLQKTWNQEKEHQLKTLWQKCSDYYGFPKLSKISELRKLAKLINLYCDTKASVPSELAEAVKAVEDEGIPDTAEIECLQKPKYLGFIASPGAGGIFGGSFYFAVECVKKFPMGYDIDGEGQRVQVHRMMRGWGYFQLFLSGNTSGPYPHYKTEEELMKNWAQMKKENEVFEGDPRKIKLA